MYRKQELQENGKIPFHILWSLTIIAGISVANLYYNQPLLNIIRKDLCVSEFQTNIITMITQTGYASGLFFIVPLGALYHQKKIILINFILLILSLPASVGRTTFTGYGQPLLLQEYAR